MKQTILRKYARLIALVGANIQKGQEVLILSVGNRLPAALEIRKELILSGHDAAVLNMRFIKPWDRETVSEMARGCRLIVTLEDGVIRGGFGESVAAYFASEGNRIPVLNIGIPDEFVPQGNVPELERALHVDPKSVTEKILGRLS